MPLPSALRPLRHRDFALLFGAGLVSHVGSWMQTVAVGALIVDATGKASWAALVAAAQFLPIGVLSPVGGALADRLSRKPFLVAGNVMLTALAGLLALLSASGHATPGVVVLVVLVAGCVAALTFPFQQAILPELVPRDDLVGAVSLGSAEYNLGRVIGPALAGVVIAASSFTWVFAINAVSFVAVVAALAVIRFQERPVAPAERLLESIRAGGRAAWQHPGCRSAIQILALAALLISPFIALVPAMADVLVDGGKQELARATSALITAQGLGAVIGALALAPVTERLGTRRAVVVNLVGSAVCVIAYSVAANLLVAVVAIFAVGAFYIGVLNGLGAVVQLQAPAAFRGRIISLFFVALGSVYPIGSLLQGAIADQLGLRETTALTAVALVVVLGLIGALRPATLRALEADAEREPASDTVTEPPEAASPVLEGR